MNRALFILFVFLNAATAQGQYYNADSLKRLLSWAKEDTSRVVLLSQLSTAYRWSAPDTALLYGLQGLRLAQQIRYKKGEHLCRANLAGAWWSMGDYATAIKLLLANRKEAEATNDPGIVVLYYVVLVSSYRDQGDYAEALQYAFNIRERSMQAFHRPLRINTIVLTDLYLKKNQLDSARFYLREAFASPPDAGLEGWPYFVAGEMYTKTKQYDSAFYYYRRSILSFLKENNFKDLAGAYNRLAALFKAVGLTDSAIYYAHKSLNVARSKKFAREAMDAYLQLSIAYERLNIDSALHYYKQAIASKDTLYNQDKQRQILSYKFNEQLRQQEIENERAQFRSRMKLNFSLVAVGVFIFIGFLLLRNNRQKQKANALLERQNREIEKARREAQIEAALERVRARTMAMQKSDELSAVAILLFNQVKELGIKTWTTGFNVWSEDNNYYTDYITSPQGGFIEPYTIDATCYSVFKEMSDAKKNGEEFYVHYEEGEQLKETYRQLGKFGDKEQYKKILEGGFEFPVRQFEHVVFGSKVSLLFITYDPVPEAYDIFKRFGKVFEQTYTRFLDLQKAEVQAREAIKASSLDRIRAEIASMRTADDLQRITPTIWKELTTLGVPFFRCGVFIMEEKEKKVHIYLSTPDGRPLAVLQLGFEHSLFVATAVKHWQSKEVYRMHWSREQFTAWVQSLSGQGLIQSVGAYQGGDAPPESLTIQLIPFTQGMLYVGSAEALTEAQIDLVKALAEAFAVAYARYEDFKSLEEAKRTVELTLKELKATQVQLIQREKMASLGELTAGIAHEIQNPLNFVNNFSEVGVELLDEAKEHIAANKKEELIEAVESAKDNLQKVIVHGRRADAIVKSMLEHSRTSKGEKQPADINALVDEYLRLSYHGMRAKNKSFNVTMETHFNPAIGKVNIVPQDIGRVLLNLFNNAFYSVSKKKQQASAGFDPVVAVHTQKTGKRLMICIRDNGLGIPESVKEKVFQPFFTTKPTGEGTGLGLSLSYDIVKAHGGELKVKSKEGEFAEFTVLLPC